MILAKSRRELIDSRSIDLLLQKRAMSAASTASVFVRKSSLCANALMRAGLMTLTLLLETVKVQGLDRRDKRLVSIRMQPRLD
jgi:hypothetical protein